MTAIFETSKRNLRKLLRGPKDNSSILTNIVRLCARRPHTLLELSSLSLRDRKELGLPPDYWGAFSDINVASVIGDLANREILVRVGSASERLAAHRAHFKWRTSFLAFLVCPELAHLEPYAYSHYLSTLFASPASRSFFLGQLRLKAPNMETESVHRFYEWQQLILLTFPALIEHGFVVTSERPDLGDVSGASAVDRHRIFGDYFVSGLPVLEEKVSTGCIRQLVIAWRASRRVLSGYVQAPASFCSLHQPTLDAAFSQLPTSTCNKFIVDYLRTVLNKKRTPSLSGPTQEQLVLDLVDGQALFTERIKPVPLTLAFG